MEKKFNGVDNLIPTNRRSKEEARELGRKGGIKSGKVRKEKKIISEMYAEALAKTFDIEIGEKDNKSTVTFTFQQLLNYTIMNVLSNGGSPAVSLLKEIREGTEGTNMQLSLSGGEMPIEIKQTIDRIKAKVNDSKGSK